MISLLSKLKDWLKPPRYRIEDIDPDSVPKHVAIIMDGNGRWAQRRGLPRIAGHRAGAKAIREVVELAPRLGIEYITLFTFSAENWRRPKDEVTGLMKLFKEMLENELDQLHKNNVRLMTIGAINEIDLTTREAFVAAVETTEHNTGLKLVVALNYSGRVDILSAVDKIVAAAAAGAAQKKLQERDLSAALGTAGIPDPELIIRTSGELRLSNFLIWESAYSEFWVTDTLWPDFNRRHLINAVYDYQHRERRFGGI
ncbi:MAG: isoprenyl transferase [Actinomycetota bacterium]|nr:isoprenyl transferase [Actinomycetota bacterium]